VRDLALIADALARCEALGEPVVLATVVRTEGSTYRRAGARMLLHPDGDEDRGGERRLPGRRPRGAGR
jgi:xanthine/CO dehydrogenase XdhC/CoxF family maturation factor